MKTAQRAVSAREWLTPLAVLLPILATVVTALLALIIWPPLVLVAVLLGLAVTASVGRRTCGTRIALATAGLTLVAGVVALFVAFWASVSTSICGKSIADAWVWVPWTVATLVYLAVGSYGFRTVRPVFVVPMGLLFGAFTLLVLIRVVPGTPGYCD